VSENNINNTSVVVTCTGNGEGIITATLNLSDGTATAPGDYNNSPITVSFSSGETIKTVSIGIVNDSLYEWNETINLSLSNVTGQGTLGTISQAVLTIKDDETLAGVEGTTRVSISSTGVQASQGSYYPSLNEDGRYVAYWSKATNLVPGDTNGKDDIFLFDNVTKKTTRVSISSNGTQAIDNSGAPSINGNGRYVSYASMASNLVSGDNNGVNDIFLYDALTKTTKRVSVTSSGLQGTGESKSPSISTSGRYISYWSSANNLVFGDTNNFRDVFVYDTVTGNNSRVSVNSSGIQGNGDSHYPSISGDGRYVSYWSNATNLVSGDSNNRSDIFVYDTSSKTTRRISVTSSGIQGNGTSNDPAISGDGRYVAYTSFATNLVTGDTNLKSDIFVFDTLTATTRRVSVDSSGNQGNGNSSSPSISRDGRYVTYQSESTNLVPWDTNGFLDVFAYDLVTGKTIRLSEDSNGNPGEAGSYYPSISGDGSYVAYDSDSANLVLGDTNGFRDIFVKNLNFNPQASLSFGAASYTVNENGTAINKVTVIRSVSINSAVSVMIQLSNGTAISPNDYKNSPITVSFASGETIKTVSIGIVNDSLYEWNETINLNLSNVTGQGTLGTISQAILTIKDDENQGEVKATTKVSVSSTGDQASQGSYYPSLNEDGRYVAYWSKATNLVDGDTNGKDDVFLFDSLTKQTTRVSVTSSGAQAIDSSGAPSISGNGRYIAYASLASNLVSGDTNGVSDIFLYDTVMKTTKRVSVTSSGLQGTGESKSPSISTSGRYISYWSSANNLVSGDMNNFRDVFIYDTFTGNNSRVSVNSSGIQGNGDSHYPSISGDGRYVSYWSNATNLVSEDSNNRSDIFVYDTLTKTNRRVSVNSDGVEGNDNSFDQAISGDGVYVVYTSLARNLVVGDTNAKTDIFVFNTVTATTRRVSVDSNGVQANGNSYSASISRDGRYVTYQSESTNLVPGDTNASVDVFSYDLVTGKTRRISEDSNGNPSNGASYYPSVSGDGGYVAYESDATNLVPSDTNALRDIFVKNLTFNPQPSLAFNNNATGALSFDVDGSGVAAQAQIATLGTNLPLTNLDILVI